MRPTPPLPRAKGPRRLAATAATALLAALLCLAPAPAAAQGGSCAGVSVAPSAGPLCGFTTTVAVGTGSAVVDVFRGVPYAQPPVGRLRWADPAPLEPWITMRPATQFGNACMQPGPVVIGTTLADTLPRSEDCLYLNVWRPHGAAPGDTLPVMVFIHGGAFVEGTGALPIYDGSYLAGAGRAVVVTINYRLGAYGFLYHTPLFSGARSLGGNYGLLDQQAALRWVRDNVAAFGGSPGRVTLFGESAGAMSVGLHLFSVPSSNRLFRAAIMESNPMGVPYRGRIEADLAGETFIDALCGKTCFLTDQRVAGFTTAQIQAAQAVYDAARGPFRLATLTLATALPWAPVLDGTTVVSQPMDGFRADSLAKPYVFGMNRDEGILFAALAQVAVKPGPAEYDVLLGKLFGANALKILGVPAYDTRADTLVAPLDATATALSDVIGDFAFDCGNLASADSATRQEPALPVFAYRFEQRPFFNGYDSTSTLGACMGQHYDHVCHGYELPYVFNTLVQAGQTPTNPQPVSPRPSDVQVANQMSAAWLAFAANPNAAPLPSWQPYAGGRLFTFGGTSTPGRMQTGLAAAANCTSLWNTFAPLGPPPAASRGAR